MFIFVYIQKYLLYYKIKIKEREQIVAFSFEQKINPDLYWDNRH